MLRGALHRLRDAHHFVGDPLLQPHERREVGAPAAYLLKEARQERRCERWWVMHQVVQDSTQLVGAPVLGGEQPRHPAIRLLGVGRVGDGTQGHVPYVLEIAHAQHCRHGPELAHRQRCDALIFPDDQLEQGGIESPIGVRNELHRELVHARIGREWTRSLELWQLVVVFARERSAHFAHLLDDDIEIVEQPLASRADRDTLGGGATEHRVGAAEDALCRRETSEQRSSPTRTPAARGVDDLLSASEMPAVPRKAIRAEQLTKNHFAGRVRHPHIAEAGRGASPAT